MGPKQWKLSKTQLKRHNTWPNYYPPNNCNKIYSKPWLSFRIYPLISKTKLTQCTIKSTPKNSNLKATKIKSYNVEIKSIPTKINLTHNKNPSKSFNKDTLISLLMNPYLMPTNNKPKSITRYWIRFPMPNVCMNSKNKTLIMLSYSSKN